MRVVRTTITFNDTISFERYCELVDWPTNTKFGFYHNYGSYHKGEPETVEFEAIAPDGTILYEYSQTDMRSDCLIGLSNYLVGKISDNYPSHARYYLKGDNTTFISVTFEETYGD